MSRKIPSELYDRIYDFYTDRLNEGVYVTKIADLFNEHFGTDFAESSLRNRYEFQRDFNNIDNDLIERLAELEKAERKLAIQEMNIVSQQKKIQRQQSSINSQIRYNADKELVAEIYNQQERQGFTPKDLTVKQVETPNAPIFNLSDDHYGYDEKGYYNIETARAYILDFFSYVKTQIVLRNLDEVVITHTGDQIEGSLLRITQLSIIAETMSQQAVEYEELFTDCLLTLADSCPHTHIRVYFIDEDNHSQIRVAGASRGDTKDFLAKAIANGIRKSVETAKRYGGLTNVTFVHGGEIFINMNGRIGLLTHGHNYSKNAKQLAQKVFDIHDIRPDFIIHGHYHNFSVTSLNVSQGFQQTVISAPGAVGNTDYGAVQLGLSGLSGFLEIDVTDSNANAKFIKLEVDR